MCSTDAVWRGQGGNDLLSGDPEQGSELVSYTSSGTARARPTQLQLGNVEKDSNESDPNHRHMHKEHKKRACLHPVTTVRCLKTDVFVGWPVL